MRPQYAGWGVLKRVLAVLSSVAVSAAAAALLKHQNLSYFLFFTMGVIVSSYSGLLPGLAATLLSLLAADYLFMQPIHGFVPRQPADAAAMILFLAIGVAISFLQHSLRRTNAALQKTVRQLRGSNEDLERFSFVLAHDLLEPLRSIQAMTQLFLSQNESKLDQDSARMLGFVVSGADRMKRLILDILEFARMGRNAEASRVEAQAVAESALRYLREAVNQSGARITVGPLPLVQVYEGHLLRLFLNLIGNAIKYRSERTPEIHISASRQGDECVFSVMDNGIGIDPQYHGQIFEPFRRLHSASEYEGSGVGLAICKRIVERYHGRIWVESQPGIGSTFCFTLPSATAAESPAQDAKRKPNQASGPRDGRGRSAAS